MKKALLKFIGTWDIVASPDFDDEYLSEDGAPYLTLRQHRDRVEGEYRVGLQTGNVDGRLDGPDRILFSFEGMDEMDPVNGGGTITLQGGRLIFTLMYHQGDDYSFECVRRE